MVKKEQVKGWVKVGDVFTDKDKKYEYKVGKVNSVSIYFLPSEYSFKELVGGEDKDKYIFNSQLFYKHGDNAIKGTVRLQHNDTKMEFYKEIPIILYKV